ncbi:hypothetical protein F5148DRAFT_1303720 [Russula earlei]|uniref:Uncharacterized protein n=1 Tax=Russula earlei TaxID=71964 RepID=A0ACC0TRD2_9AGAM|nr:hypothetical protein F5148DRAFT_1303720 [Russula earlei]
MLLFTQQAIASRFTYTDTTAQKAADAIQTGNLNGKAISSLNSQYSDINQQLDKQTTQYLNRLQKKEQKMQQKLQGIDSVKAKQLFGNTTQYYAGLQQKLQSPVQKLKQYVPGLDSISTATKFLQQANLFSMLSKSSGHTVGPNSLLKVMAGDEMSAAVQYYFENSTTNTSTNSLAADIIASLAGALSGDPATVGTGLHNSATASAVTNNLDPTAIAGVADPNQFSTTLPRAYLTILFFDERFNYVAEGSTSQPVQTSGDGASPLILANIKAPKNGYVYVYIQHVRGRILEENHYYAFGLKIAGISSHELPDAAEGHVDNPYGYQGDFSQMDDEIGWNDFELRNYDPQIGRWIQPDPFDEFESPYIGMGNDPVNLIDPTGGDALYQVWHAGVQNWGQPI